jgi:hypothetical protein
MQFKSFGLAIVARASTRKESRHEDKKFDVDFMLGAFSG